MNTAFERSDCKDEWITPKFIIDALAPFDLDPCSPVPLRRPWPTASQHYTVEDNGLIKPWLGFVWCNPPYGNQTQKWFRRMAEHNNGIALTFARTETKMFFASVWPVAQAIFFIKKRLAFCDTTGVPGGTAGSPSVLIAYGQTALERLQHENLEGKLVTLN